MSSWWYLHEWRRCWWSQITVTHSLLEKGSKVLTQHCLMFCNSSSTIWSKEPRHEFMIMMISHGSLLWIWYRIHNMECISCLLIEYSIAYFLPLILFFLSLSFIRRTFFPEKILDHSSLLWPRLPWSRKLNQKNSFLSLFTHSDKKKKVKRRQRWFNYSIYLVSNFFSSNFLLLLLFFFASFSSVCPLFSLHFWFNTMWRILNRIIHSLFSFPLLQFFLSSSSSVARVLLLLKHSFKKTNFNSTFYIRFNLKSFKFLLQLRIFSFLVITRILCMYFSFTSFSLPVRIAMNYLMKFVWEIRRKIIRSGIHGTESIETGSNCVLSSQHYL